MRRTVITVDAVERRGGVDHGDAKSIPAARFVRPAKASDLKGKRAAEAAEKKTASKAAGADGKKSGGRKANEKPAGGKKVGKKPTVASAIRSLFAEHGLEATYAQAETAAKAAKPDTKFSKSHWAWYRAQHKKTVAAAKGASR